MYPKRSLCVRTHCRRRCQLFRMNEHLLPANDDSVTLYITQRDMRTWLEYEKVDAWVFLKTCFELFFFCGESQDV